MKRNTHDLITALSLGLKEHIAVVGGGGKSTLCLAMAKALMDGGKRVISTTTTKVRETESSAFPRLLLFFLGAVEPDSVSCELDEMGNVFVGRTFIENGKIEGISAAEADSLFRVSETDHVIVEADGAAGRPLKAPAAHEPVIPGSATLVIAVIGLSALGKPMGPETVFRPELFRTLTGLEDGDPLDAQKLISVFDDTAGLFKGTPDSARRIVFLNQMDMLSNRQAALNLADGVLTKYSLVERVVLGSLIKNQFVITTRN